ncbi:MAG: hypothetical protein RLY21_268 [Planctomycetota bacterium]|jgi:hypothetical protein
MTTQPPPPPSRLPPTSPSQHPTHPPVTPDAFEQVNRVAETIAGPNLRVKDNLMQLIACAGGALLGGVSCTIAAMVAGEDVFKFALIGTIGGLIVGLFGSGIALMVIGFVRASKRKS